MGDRLSVETADGISRSAIHEYLLNRDLAPEEERLRLLAGQFDPWTVGHLERIGVRPGWACLEAGAGSGSIARWLHEAVGPDGSVVAADIDTRFLTGVASPGLDVRQCDLRSDEFPAASFDLIHARYVLCHLPDRAAVMRRMLEWLRPGGWLLCEEPDIFGPMASPDPAWRRWWEATGHVAEVDSTCGRAIPTEVQSLGLKQVDADVNVVVVRAGEPSARLHELTLEVLRGVFEGRGLLPSEDIDGLLGRLAGPDLVDFGMTSVAAWGRKPPC